MTKTILSICAVAALILSSCYNDNFKELHPTAVSSTCDTSNTVTYDADVKSIINNNCVSCHNTGGTKPYLDSYQNVIAYSPEQLLAVLATNAPKPMPPSSPLSQADIAKITSWVSGCRPFGAHVNTTCDTSAAMSFSADVVPILNSNCTNGCHDNIGFGHALLTYTDVINDTFIYVNNTSYLVNSLIDANTSKRMPLARPALSACQIAKIRRWVTEGSNNN